MTTALAVVPRSVAEAEQLSNLLARSSLISDALRGKPADLLACILTGAELGLPPMASVKAIVMIKGRPTLSAQALMGIALAHPSCIYIRKVESTDLIATYEAMRKGYPEPVRLSWTAEQAKAAGLGGDNWRKYGAEMLRARCQAAIVRMVFPDAMLGLYATEEISEEAEVVDAEVVPKATARPALPAVKPERQPGEDDEVPLLAEEISPREKMRSHIKGAGSVAALEALVPEIQKLSELDREAVRPDYGKRRAELAKGVAQ